jgi:hypothetical protein
MSAAGVGASGNVIRTLPRTLSQLDHAAVSYLGCVADE